MNDKHPPGGPETLRSALARVSEDLHRHAPAARVPAEVLAAMAQRGRAGGAHPAMEQQAGAHLEMLEQRGPAGEPMAAPEESARAAEPPRRTGWRAAWAGGALAMATTVAAVAILTLAPQDPAMAPQRAAVSTDFMPVANTERWARLMADAREQGSAWVVPAELPRDSLASMGLPYDPSRAGEPVRAELLVHTSGDVLAVRFVQP